MPLARVSLKSGIVKDETPLASRPQWTDGDKIRFWRDRPQPVGGAEVACVDTFTGKCRGLLAWKANDQKAYGAVGTHTKLYAFYGGRLYDITPIRSTGSLGAGPLATTSGSATITVTHTSHGAATGDTVYISGATSVATVQVGVVSPSLTGAFTTTSGSPTVVVADTAHGLANGDIVDISGGSAVGGITLSGTYTVFVLDADSYQVQHTANASSTATGGGSPTTKYFKPYTLTKVDANSYTITASSTANATTTGGGGSIDVKYELTVGNENGSGGGGYGIGGFGSGGYGIGADPSAAFARTWSLAQWGEYLIANPRGGGVYEWQLNLSKRAAVVTNAPTAVYGVFVTTERILVTLQRSQVQWSDQEDNTAWTPSATNKAGDFPIAGGVAGKAGTQQNLIWTDRGLYAMRFNGDPGLVFSFLQLGADCGLMGPNAVMEKDGFAFWCGVNKQFYAYDGGSVRTVDSGVRDFFFDDVAPAQDEKIYVGTNSQFDEVWIFYPSETDSSGSPNLECNRYLTWNWKQGHWSVGSWARSAWMDRSGLGNPVAADTSGVLYFHEAGTGEAGSALNAYVTSSPFEMQQGDQYLDILKYHCDFERLAVGVYLTVVTQEYPNAAGTSNGPFLITPSSETVDFRASGRQAYITYTSASDANAFWRLGDVRFEIQPSGRRR